MSSNERGCLIAFLILVSLITLLGSVCGLGVAVGSHSEAAAGYTCCAIGLTLTILVWVWIIRMWKPRKQDSSQEVR
jgi:hypothetical protein